MTEFKEFTIDFISYAPHVVSVHINHPKMEYNGIITIIDIANCPGFNHYYDSGKNGMADIKICRGILFHSDYVGVNVFSPYTKETRDLEFGIFGVAFSFKISNGILTINLEDTICEIDNKELTFNI